MNLPRIIMFTMCLALPGLAMAEDAAPPLVDNPYRAEIEAQNKAFGKSLSADEKEALTYIMTGFGMIQAVKITQNEMTVAVKHCAEENPNLADDINARLKTWKNAVEPEIAANKKAMEATLKGDLFSHPDKIKSYMKLVDKSADHSNDNIKKDYISDEKSCKGLIASMDRTQDKIVELLKDINWPAAHKRSKE